MTPTPIAIALDAAGFSAKRIASLLNSAGFRRSRGRRFLASHVLILLCR